MIYNISIFFEIMVKRNYGQLTFLLNHFFLDKSFTFKPECNIKIKIDRAF